MFKSVTIDTEEQLLLKNFLKMSTEQEWHATCKCGKVDVSLSKGYVMTPNCCCNDCVTSKIDMNISVFLVYYPLCFVG